MSTTSSQANILFDEMEMALLPNFTAMNSLISPFTASSLKAFHGISTTIPPPPSSSSSSSSTATTQTLLASLTSESTTIINNNHPWASWGEGRESLTRSIKRRSSTTSNINGDDDDDDAGVRVSAMKMKMKRSSMKGRRKVREPRFCFKTMSDVDVLDDGYKWRKYGQKVVNNTHHPRSYYRCTEEKCGVKKRVERLAEDPRMVITTYEGRHAHSPSNHLPHTTLI